MSVSADVINVHHKKISTTSRPYSCTWSSAMAPSLCPRVSRVQPCPTPPAPPPPVHPQRAPHRLAGQAAHRLAPRSLEDLVLNARVVSACSNKGAKPGRPAVQGQGRRACVWPHAVLDATGRTGHYPPRGTSRGTMPGTMFGSVEEFVAWSGGDHAIKKILIANNGIGAIKAIRSIRRWAFETFGNERTVSPRPRRSHTVNPDLSLGLTPLLSPSPHRSSLSAWRRPKI